MILKFWRRPVPVVANSIAIEYVHCFGHCCFMTHTVPQIKVGLVLPLQKIDRKALDPLLPHTLQLFSPKQKS